MVFEKTVFRDVWIIKPEAKSDERGYFERIFCQKDFKKRKIKFPVVQINRSYNCQRGIIRGLHFQKSPNGEAKIVQVIRGEIFDVIVDIRKKSKTFGRWMSTILSEENQKMLVIPPGFAHGYQTLTVKSELLYFMSKEFDAFLSDGIRWNDPRLKIVWPIANPTLSVKDQGWALLNDL